jgi:gamma-glutamyl:cysteine ligase YbdK (ATP-grasp superfamily)
VSRMWGLHVRVGIAHRDKTCYVENLFGMEILDL